MLAETYRADNCGGSFCRWYRNSVLGVSWAGSRVVDTLSILSTTQCVSAPSFSMPPHNNVKSHFQRSGNLPLFLGAGTSPLSVG